MDLDDELITTMHPAGSYNDIRFFSPPPPRNLRRPKIIAITAIASLTASIIFVLAVFCFAYLICTPFKTALSYETIAAICCGCALLCVLIATRKAIPIWFIMLYQRFAPDEIRLRCLYTPSCSEYMTIAIIKYGLLRGIVKGIKRLKRCHHPNGGEDLP